MTYDENLAAIGRIIKLARENAGLSQAQLGEMCNLRQATISDIEQGRANFSFSTLFTIAGKLGYGVDLSLVPVNR